MIEIRLPKGIWKYNPSAPLGNPGGFGSVFSGSGNGHDKLAIKKLHINSNEAAHRELRIADELANRQFHHVMPVLDAGQDAESDFYFVVMPCAEKNLREELRKVRMFDEFDALDILEQIGLGLLEVSDIVHRDLKPENILFHDESWKIADFGISRFVEESTSPQTLKNFWTAPYAAPEQWALERATQATDIYALGCIAYELLTGSPPFSGPSWEEYSEQHRHEEPPPIKSGIQPQLRGLIIRMLRKLPQTRPSLERVVTSLRQVNRQSSTQINNNEGFRRLAEAGADEAKSSAHLEISRMEQTKLEREREELFENALGIIQDLIEMFYEKCEVEGSDLVRHGKEIGVPSHKDDLFAAHLGKASIDIKLFSTMHDTLLPKGFFRNSGWDVVVGATIIVTQGNPNPYKWGANLWYTNLGSGSEFRWWEVSYYDSNPPKDKLPFEPHAVSSISDADYAASPIASRICMAAKPMSIDDENAESFFDRWADILGKAYYGVLKYPSHLPLS